MAQFGWFEAPDPAALEAALDLLRRLGAIDAQGVTPLGERLAHLPTHPRLGRLLLEGELRGAKREAALLAALLAERDPFARPKGEGDSRGSRAGDGRTDLLHRLDVLESFARKKGSAWVEGLNPGAARFVLRAGEQLLDALERTREEGSGKSGGAEAGAGRDEALLRALLAAYPDRVARLREAKGLRGVMVGGRGVRLADLGLPAGADTFLCVDIAEPGGGAGPGGARSEALVRRAVAIDPAWLPPERVRTEVALEFDPARERVVGWKRTFYEDLALSEAETPLQPSPEVAALLVQEAGQRLDRALPLDDPEVASFRLRVGCLAAWMPELQLPRLEEDDLRTLLGGLSSGARSFADLRRAPLLAALEGLLSWEQLEAVRREAPERLAVPSGSQIRLQYEPGRPPVLAARIQEMFGLAATPRIAGGRVGVLLHLLAPNGRPQQVTEDLASFWANTYPQVRKELAGRYPKHAWPLDPWNARPERRPQRRP